MDNPTIREMLEDNFLEIALECVFLTKEKTPLKSLRRLERLFNDIKGEWKNSELMVHRMEEFTSYVDALEILEKYYIYRRMQDFRMKEIRQKGKELLQEMCRKSIRVEDLKPSILTQDLKRLKRLLFSNLKDEIIAEVVLLSGNIELMKQFLQENMKYLQMKKFVKIIADMGREFISSASSPHELGPARECFELINDSGRTSKITQELDFIQALEMLDSEFGMEVAPIEIRQMNRKQKTQWLKEVVQESPRMFRDMEMIEDIARLLRIPYGDAVIVACARAAVKNEEWDMAKEIIFNMDQSSVKESWDLCVDTAKKGNFPSSVRKQLICQAIWGCPVSNLTTTLRMWETATASESDTFQIDADSFQATAEDNASKLVDRIFDGCRKREKMSERNKVSQHLATSLCGPEPNLGAGQYDSIFHYLARQSLNENSLVAQAYMAMTSGTDPLDIESDNPWAQNSAALFNLRFLVARLVSISGVEVNATDVFHMDSQQIMKVIGKVQEAGSLSTEGTKLLNLAREQCSSLNQSDNLSQFIEICPEIDTQRLMSDGDYCEEQVHALALSVDKEKVDMGMSLCNQFEQQLDVWEFVMLHLEYVTESQDLETMKQCFEARREYVFTDENVNKFSEMLDTSLYEKCPGDDLSRMKYLLELQLDSLETIGNKRSQKKVCKDKIRIVEMIQNPNIPSMSFKRLVDASTCEEEIKKVISKDSLSIFRTVLHRLNPVLKPKTLSKADIHGLLLQKIAESETAEDLDDFVKSENILVDVGLEDIMKRVSNLERKDSHVLEMKMKLLELTLECKELSEDDTNRIKIEQSFGEVLLTLSFLPTEARAKLTEILGTSGANDKLYSTICTYVLNAELSEKHIERLVAVFQKEFLAWQTEPMKKAMVDFFAEGLTKLGANKSRVRMFKRVAKMSKSIIGTGKGSIVGKLMTVLVDWTLSADGFDKQRLESLDYLSTFEQRESKIATFLSKTSKERQALRDGLQCQVKVRSVLPEAKFGADVDVVEYCLSKGSSLPPDVQLSILECILGVDEIQSKPTEWEKVIDFILELDTAKLEIEKLCSICHDITKRAALPIDSCDKLFHFMSSFSILEGIRIALLSPHGELHQKACQFLKQKSTKREQWWFFSPNMQEYHDDMLLDLLLERNVVHLFYDTNLESPLFERMNQEQLLSEAGRALNERNLSAAFTTIQLWAGIPKLLHDAQTARLLLDSHFETHSWWMEIRNNF